MLLQKRFPGRGGGLSTVINSVTTVTITVTNCTFQSNLASQFGGGVYTILDGLSNHIITFQSCDFIENESDNHAGGMEIGFSRNGNETYSNRVLIYDSNFVGNKAIYGGGVYFFYIGEEGEWRGRGRGREE